VKTDRKVALMARRLFGWMAPKRGENVLKMVEDHLELTKNAVRSLYRLVESASEEKGDTKELYNRVSDLEMEADDLRRKMVDELTKGEMFPEERQDLMELVRAVDWIADWSKEAGRILIIIPFHKAPEEMKKAAQDMCRANLDCVSILAKCIHELHSNNPNEAISLANQVELLEEELDELYSIARGHLATMEFPDFSTGALILLNMFLDALETVADWCENTADIVRAVAVRIQ
jgi:predicted phosphate transport protein (TIGR00153 family)